MLFWPSDPNHFVHVIQTICCAQLGNKTFGGAKFLVVSLSPKSGYGPAEITEL